MFSIGAEITNPLMMKGLAGKYMIKINRFWAMPDSNTFQIKPIREFVLKYLNESKISVDPFSRNSALANYTNDLNPDTTAQYHLTAFDFLTELINKGVRADLIIFDPPYSLRQAKECYDAFYPDGFNGRQFKNKDLQISCFFKKKSTA